MNWLVRGLAQSADAMVRKFGITSLGELARVFAAAVVDAVVLVVVVVVGVVVIMAGAVAVAAGVVVAALEVPSVVVVVAVVAIVPDPLSGTLFSDPLFLLWVTPTATPTITATTTSAPTIMIARPLVVRCHGVDVDLLTSFEKVLAAGGGMMAGFSREGREPPEARGAKGGGDGSEVRRSISIPPCSTRLGSNAP